MEVLRPAWGDARQRLVLIRPVGVLRRRRSPSAWIFRHDVRPAVKEVGGDTGDALLNAPAAVVVSVALARLPGLVGLDRPAQGVVGQIGDGRPRAGHAVSRHARAFAFAGQAAVGVIHHGGEQRSSGVGLANLLQLIRRVVHIGKGARRGGVDGFGAAVAYWIVGVVFLGCGRAVADLRQTIQIVVLVDIVDG